MAGGTQRPLALISARAENSRGVLVKDVGMVDSGFLSTSIIMRGTGILEEGGVGFSIRLESGPSVGFTFCFSVLFDPGSLLHPGSQLQIRVLACLADLEPTELFLTGC